MKFFKYLFTIFLSFIMFLNISKADVGSDFNNLINEKHDFTEYPYSESRNDVGIFYEFAFDFNNKIIKIKRDKNNFPIVRFSLFEKQNIIPGDVIVSFNKINLSLLSDNEIIDLHRKSSVADLNILNKEDNVKVISRAYKLNNIKLVNFDLKYINTIDTTKGVMDISFDALFLNERPELSKYAEGLLGDAIYSIDHEIFDEPLYLPIEAVTFSEYLKNVDIRVESAAEFSFDKNSLRTVMRDSGIAQFRQKFDFKQFPFDKQKLKIKINSGAHSTSYPDLNWPRGISSVTFVTPDIGAFIGLSNYKNENLLSELGWTLLSTNIVSEEVIDKNYFDPYLNKSYDYHENTIDIVLEIKRNSAHYLFKIIIPVFLILCVAWSVLWIPTYKLDARLTTSIVALLSLIAYNFVFEGDIPKLDYLTDLDKYILLSYIFCCIPTFISIGFSRFIQKTAKMQRRVTKVNAHIRKWGGVIYLLITFQIFYSVN